MVINSEALKLLSEITAFLKQSLGPDKSVGARLKFVYPNVGVVMIDGRKIPNLVSNKDEEADCVVEIDPVVHLKLLRREMDQGLAFRRGLLRISGDVAIAVQLGPLLSKSKNRGAS